MKGGRQDKTGCLDPCGDELKKGIRHAQTERKPDRHGESMERTILSLTFTTACTTCRSSALSRSYIYNGARMNRGESNYSFYDAQLASCPAAVKASTCASWKITKG